MFKTKFVFFLKISAKPTVLVNFCKFYFFSTEDVDFTFFDPNEVKIKHHPTYTTPHVAYFIRCTKHCEQGIGSRETWKHGLLYGKSHVKNNVKLS